jgi:nicotinate-nucleotide adenylyltransferase
VRFALALDRLLLVVANIPWQKAGSRRITPAPDRLAMVEAAVEGVDGLEASSLEIDRGGTSYTADTLEQLRLEDPAVELFVVLGSDAAAALDTWERADAVRQLATLVVVDRPGGDDVPVPAGFSVERVRAPRLEVSSTDLRARFADGRPLDYLVPNGVIDCINQRGLYRYRSGR